MVILEMNDLKFCFWFLQLEIVKNISKLIYDISDNIIQIVQNFKNNKIVKKRTNLMLTKN